MGGGITSRTAPPVTRAFWNCEMLAAVLSAGERAHAEINTGPFGLPVRRNGKNATRCSDLGEEHYPASGRDEHFNGVQIELSPTCRPLDIVDRLVRDECSQ